MIFQCYCFMFFRCEDWSKFEIALELAANHNVLAFDVALSHVIALLLNNNCNVLTERLTDNRLSMLLKENPNLVSTRSVLYCI